MKWSLCGCPLNKGATVELTSCGGKPGEERPRGRRVLRKLRQRRWLSFWVSSEIVMDIVSGQVVTSCLRTCKIFVTSKFSFGPVPPSGMAPSPQRNRPMPGASDRHRATGERRGQQPGMGPLTWWDYLIVAPDEFPRQNDPQGEKSQERARSNQSNHLSRLSKHELKLYVPSMRASCC